MFKEDIHFFLSGNKPAIMLRKNAAKNYIELNEYKSFTIGESKVWFKEDEDFATYAKTGCLATLLGYPKQSIKDVKSKIADTDMNFQGMHIKFFNKNLDAVVNQLKEMYGNESIKGISVSKFVSKSESATRVRVQQSLLERQLDETSVALIPIAKDREIRYDCLQKFLKVKVSGEDMYLASKSSDTLLSLVGKELAEIADEVIVHPDKYEGFEETNDLYLVESNGIRFLSPGSMHGASPDVRVLKAIVIQSGMLPDVVRLIKDDK